MAGQGRGERAAVRWSQGPRAVFAVGDRLRIHYSFLALSQPSLEQHIVNHLAQELVEHAERLWQRGLPEVRIVLRPDVRLPRLVELLVHRRTHLHGAEERN